MYKAYEFDHLISSHTKSVVQAIAGAQTDDLISRLGRACVALFDAQIWFSGLRTQFASLPDSEQAMLAGKIIAACDSVQSEVKSFYEGLDVTLEPVSEITEHCNHARESAMLLYDELELSRWDAMEWQADADIGNGRVSGPFASVDQLLGSLRH